ncbi:MAG: Arm DNA-binding domain-containing protein [Bacillaceae bacterium]|nr:Arm DNA-binding domain-containing protein [Bacillaceae bacterium]
MVQKTAKRKQKWFSGYRTKKEAQKAMSQTINDLSQGTFIEPSEEKVREYLTLWLQNKKNEY